jgi:hypothetical protein
LYPGYKFTQSYGTYEAVYTWEPIPATECPEDDTSFHTTANWEASILPPGTGQVQAVDATGYDTFGNLEEAITGSDQGVGIDYIPFDDNVLVVYKARPVDVYTPEDDILGWPDWVLKYIERYTLALAFTADTDAKNHTAAQYWMGRYLHGVKVLKRYAAIKFANRRPALKTHRRLTEVFKEVRLPDTYQRWDRL